MLLTEKVSLIIKFYPNISIDLFNYMFKWQNSFILSETASFSNETCNGFLLAIIKTKLRLLWTTEIRVSDI